MSLPRSQFNSVVGVLTAAVLVSACSAAGQSVMLTPKFTSGTTIYRVGTEDTVQKATGGQFGEAGMEFKSSETYGLLQKVEPAPEGKGSRIVMTFDRVAQSTQNPMMNLSFDSDLNDPTDRSDPLAIVYGPVLGMSVTMDLEADKKITSFSGMDAIWSKVQESAVGSPMLGQVRDKFSDRGGRAEFGEAQLALYPNKEVKTGDTWQSEVRFPTPAGDFITELKMKLERVGKENDRKVAVVSYTTSTRQAPETKDQPVMGGMTLEIISSEGTGTATYDIAKGMFVQDQTDTKMVVALRRLSAVSEDSDTETEAEGDQAESEKSESDNPVSEKPEADAEAKDSAGSESKDAGAEESPPAPPAMTIEIARKESYKVMTTAQRDKEREENRAKAKAMQEAEEDEDWGDEDDEEEEAE